MTESTQTAGDVTPEALYAMLWRAMRNTAILAVLLSITLGAAAIVFSVSAAPPANVAYADDGCGWVCTQIKHVVIIVKENHSFDNMFGRFVGADRPLPLCRERSMCRWE